MHNKYRFIATQVVKKAALSNHMLIINGLVPSHIIIFHQKYIKNQFLNNMQLGMACFCRSHPTVCYTCTVTMVTLCLYIQQLRIKDAQYNACRSVWEVVNIRRCTHFCIHTIDYVYMTVNTYFVVILHSTTYVQYCIVAMGFTVSYTRSYEVY